MNKNRINLKTIILVAVLTLFGNYSLKAQVDTRGKDFWVAFGQNAFVTAGNQSNLILQIRIAADAAATGTITFTNIVGVGNTVTFSVPAGGVFTHTLSANQKMASYHTATGVSNQSVRIQTDVPVSVYAFNTVHSLADATNLLPVQVLGNDYYHLGRGGSNTDQYFVIAPENGTIIYENGTQMATLSAGDVYFKQAPTGGDMSGYHITSNKPIAYFSAHNYCIINGGGDNFFQQFSPVNTWGKNFLVPVTNRELELIRIVASQNNTTITQTGGTIESVAGGQNSLNLNAGEWVELKILLSNGGCYIQSDKPVQVCSYMVGSLYAGAVIPYGGDESICLIPPIEQTVNEALIAPFAVSTLNTHFALIATPTANKNSTTVSMGGATPTALSGGTWYDNAAAGMSFYSVQLINTSSSYLFSNSAGLIAYGYGFGSSISYYYMAGSAVRELDASFYVNEIHNQDLPAVVFDSNTMHFDAEINGTMSSTPGFLKWYINGIEEVAARDLDTWTKNLPNGIYQIKMLITWLDNTTRTVESTLTVGSPFSIATCPRDSITLKTNINNGGTLPKFQWFKNGVLIAGATDSLYKYLPQNGDTITCRLISDADCADPDTVFSHYIVITVHNAPKPTLTDTTLSFLQNATAPSLTTATGAVPATGFTLKWYQSDTTTIYTGANTPINTTTPGIYRYFISQTNDTTGCESVKVPIYVVILKPQALSYVSCPNADVTVGVDTIGGVSFYWYATSTGGSPLTSNSNTHTITNIAPPTTVWVEPRVGAEVCNRQAVTVTLSQSCGGTPMACATTGTVIYREDFGGNSPTDPDVKPTGIAQMSSIYTYVTLPAGMLTAKTYSICKQSLYHPSWNIIDDHTYANDTTRGYLLMVNADAAKGQFYEVRIDGLCENMMLYFSAWITSIARGSSVHKTNQIFTLEDTTGTIIAQYNTGDVPEPGNNWKQYGFGFTVPAGITSLKLRIVNNGAGTSGNDFAMDDIEIRVCAPPVTLTVPSTSDTAVCLGEPLTLTANYTDDGTFGSSLAYRWEYSLTGDINNPATWTTLTSGTGTSPLNRTYSIAGIAASDTGFYRLLVSSPASINDPNCRAMSNPVQVKLGTTQALTVPTQAISYWKNETASTLLLATGVVASAGHTLTWYQSDTVTVYTGANSTINTSTPGLYTYFVNQTNTISGCVSEKVPVYVVVLEREVQHYVACPGSDVLLKVKSVTGANMYWYSVPTGGTALSINPADSHLVTNVTPPDTFWVEARIGGVSSTRLPLMIELSTVCGDTIVPFAGCLSGGTLLYKQDFGGNNTLDMPTSLTALPAGSSGMNHCPLMFGSGCYALTKQASRMWHEYHRVGDHTHLGDTNRGYLMVVDPSAGDFGKVLYQTDITNLCSGMTLSFSAWYMDLYPVNPPNYSPRIEMQMVNKADNSIIISTGITTIPKGNTWKQYGFDFTLPVGVTDVVFKIINRENTTAGNDLGIDDIEIRSCSPLVAFGLSDSIVECERSPLTLSGTYTDDGTFGNDLVYQWEYSTTGDINVPSDWTVVSGSNGSSNTGTINASYLIPSLSQSDTGYYRLIVGNTSTINRWACRATSKTVRLVVKKRPTVSITGSGSICVGTTTQLSPTTGGTWSSTNPSVATVTNAGLVTGISTGSVQFVFTDTISGCSDTTIVVPVGTFPVVDSISGDKISCINSIMSLSCATSGGVWSLSNGNADIVGSNTDNPVSIEGKAPGKMYVTYTVGTGSCQSKSTFLLNVTPTTPPNLRIGFER